MFTLYNFFKRIQIYGLETFECKLQTDGVTRDEAFYLVLEVYERFMSYILWLNPICLIYIFIYIYIFNRNLFSQFWRLEIQSQGVYRTPFIGENYFLFLFRF